MIEIWKPIKGYEGLYEISNLGRVKSLVKTKGRNNHLCPEKIKSVRSNGIGYMMVTLSVNSCKKNKYIHRLVADAFISDVFGMEVNHIDGDKTNNAVPNLELVTRLENEAHAWGTGLKRMIGDNHKLSKKVIESCSLTGSFIKLWNCLSDIVREKGVDRRSIIKCCNGVNDSAHGSKWCWA